MTARNSFIFRENSFVLSHLVTILGERLITAVSQGISLKLNLHRISGQLYFISLNEDDT